MTNINNNNTVFTTENTFTNYPDLVSRQDLQQMLAIGKNTAYTLLNSGEIQSIKIYGAHKIPKRNIIAYLNKQYLQSNSDMLQCAYDTVGGFREVTAND